GKALAAGTARAMALHAVGLEGRAAAGEREVEQLRILADLLERGGADAVDEGRARLGLPVEFSAKRRAIGISQQPRRWSVEPRPGRIKHAINYGEHDGGPEGVDPPGR